MVTWDLVILENTGDLGHVTKVPVPIKGLHGI